VSVSFSWQCSAPCVHANDTSSEAELKLNPVLDWRQLAAISPC
jgi:hypothetical protein